jgi:hypothetical protein
LGWTPFRWLRKTVFLIDNRNFPFNQLIFFEEERKIIDGGRERVVALGGVV